MFAFLLLIISPCIMTVAPVNHIDISDKTSTFYRKDLFIEKKKNPLLSISKVDGFLQWKWLRYVQYKITFDYWDIVPAVRVFANGPGDLGSIPGRVIPKTLKMVLDTTLLNTQHYKVRFKGKVEQSWEWSSALPYTLV